MTCWNFILFIVSIAMSALIGCGSSADNSIRTSSLVFSSENVRVEAGVCEASLELVSEFSEDVALLHATAVFLQDDGTEERFEFDVSDLEQRSTSLQIPGRTSMTVTLDFDLSERNLTTPREGRVVFVAAGMSGTAQFVGRVLCE